MLMSVAKVIKGLLLQAHWKKRKNCTKKISRTEYRYE